MVGSFFKLLFGGGRNAIAETAEVFTVNREKQAQRSMDLDAASLAQYAAEYHARNNRTWVDALADAINRLVRPLLTIAIFLPIPMAIYAPEDMERVWLSMATLPEPYWIILGIVISFYFGGRMHVKHLAASSGKFAAAASEVARLANHQQPSEPDVSEPDQLEAAKPAVAMAPDEIASVDLDKNAAIAEWIKGGRGIA